jgi:hypothetical protein
MGWVESRKSVLDLTVVSVLALTLGACASLSSGNGGTVDTNAILLQKAEDRAAVAQRSAKEAEDMIADGQRQRAEGQRMIDEGQRKVETGRELKAAADIELVRAQKQVASQRAQMPQASQGASQ